MILSLFIIMGISVTAEQQIFTFNTVFSKIKEEGKEWTEAEPETSKVVLDIPNGLLIIYSDPVKTFKLVTRVKEDSIGGNLTYLGLYRFMYLCTDQEGNKVTIYIFYNPDTVFLIIQYVDALVYLRIEPTN